MYNPTNPQEISNPISIESSLFITQLMEYCTFVDPKKVDGKTIAQIAYRLVRNIKVEDQVKHFYDYLDKGLIQIAIRIRKVIVGPEQYLLKEEFVPVGISAYIVIFRKLIKEYVNRYGTQPDKNAIKLLSDKAISLACDMQDKNGKKFKIHIL